MTGPLPGADDTMQTGSGQRLALGPEAVYLEMRGAGGTWVRARALAYDEIRAVYSYEARDWGFLAVAGGVWLAAIVLILILGGLARWSSPVLVVVTLAVTALVGGAAAYRVLTVPRPVLYIDAYSGPLTIPNRSPAFFRRLAARLPREAPAAAASYAPTAVDVPGPIPEPGQAPGPAFSSGSPSPPMPGNSEGPSGP